MQSILVGGALARHCFLHNGRGTQNQSDTEKQLQLSGSMFFFHTLSSFPFSFAFDQLIIEIPTLKATSLGHIETTRFESEPSEPGTSTEFVFGHLESHRLTFAQVAEVLIKNNQDDTQKTCPAELLTFCFLQNPKHTCKSCKDIFKRWMDGEGKLPQLSPWFRHMIFLEDMKGDRESANVQ